ncbi:MAG: TonB-dependent receptor, partial [Alphaproteobacteria bacterium]
MRALRYSLFASVALLPCVAQAQNAVSLSEISVVATTPVGVASGNGAPSVPVLQAPGGPALQVPDTARLRGGALPLNKIPSTVETVTAADLNFDRATFNAVETLARRVPGLNLSDSQGNNNRVD